MGGRPESAGHQSGKRLKTTGIILNALTPQTPSGRWQRWSIRWRIFLAVLLSVMSVNLTLLIVLTVIDIRSLESTTQENAIKLSHALGQDFGQLLLFNSPDMGSNLISRLQAFPEVRQMRLYDPLGVPRFQYLSASHDDLIAPPPWGERSFAAIEENRISVMRQVSLDGVDLGMVYMALSRKGLDGWLTEFLAHLLWLVPASILLSMFIAAWVQRIISRPILEFRDAINSVASSGRYDRQFESPESNEIGDLYKGLNHLLSTIETAHTSLHDQKFALDEAALVAAFNGDWELSYCNDHFSEALHQNKARLMQRPLDELPLFTDEERSLREKLAKCAHGVVWRGAIRIARTGQHWMAATIVPFMDHGNEAKQYLMIGFDISKRIALESALRHARDQADAANQAKSQFLATMSHEIRTPMNGVIGMSELLSDCELSDEARSYADTISRAAESLLSIINDILDFSKVQAGMLRLEKIPFELDVELSDVADLLVENATQKSLSMSVDVSPGLNAHVLGDPGRIRQVMINLLGNAIKFTEQGEVGIRLCETNSRQPDYLGFRIEVFDTGIGIPQSQQKYIFDQFTQADASTSRRYGGTGLGLSISKALVELMGGQLHVESKPGAGTTFSIELLLLEDSHVGSDQPPSLNGHRLLVCDDVVSNRRVLSEHLQSLGAEVLEAEGGRQAMTLLEQGEIHGILTDHQMPGMDGLELAADIQAHVNDERPWLILISSSEKELSLSSSSSPGVDAILRKPIRLRTLDATLHAVMRGPKTEPPKSKSLLNGYHVLLVEDLPVNQQVTQQMLAMLGCGCDLASNGNEALEKLEQTRYDAILMDCHMPDLDGFETTRIIRKREQANPEISPARIIALTASVSAKDEKACRDSGMNHFLGKPFRRADLERSLIELMDL